MNPKYTFILFIILLILLLFPLTIFRESMFGRGIVRSQLPNGEPTSNQNPNPNGESPPVDQGIVTDESNPNGEPASNEEQKSKSIFKRGVVSAGPMPNNEIDKCSALLTANGIDISNKIRGDMGVTGANSSTAIAAADIGTDSAYSYLSFIKSPAELQMSDNGTLDTLEKDINGLMSYVELLVEGPSNASKSNGPLGNKFFVKTLGTCKSVGPKDKDTEQTRYFYINNVPLGKNQIPGSNYKDYRGLIPGMLQNMDVLNPEKIASSFLTTSMPDCMEITLDTIDSSGTLGTATHYVSLADIAELDPCLFPDRVNPQTNAKCTGLAGPRPEKPGGAGPGPGSAGPGSAGPGPAGPAPGGFGGPGGFRGPGPATEGFESMHDIYTSQTENESETNDFIEEDIKKDYISQLFLSSFSLLGIYILFLALKKFK